MIIFNSIWKVVKQHRTEIIIPFIVFIAFGVIASISSQKKYDDFIRTMPQVAIISHGDPIGDGLKAYLDDKVDWVELEASQFDQAIFYQQVALAFEVPSGFTQAFLNDGAVLDADLLTDSTHGYTAQEYVNDYLRNYKALYQLGYSHDQIQRMIMQASTDNPDITLIETEKTGANSVYENFSNFSVYPLFICITGVIVSILVVFDEKLVFLRTAVSSKTSFRRNLELFLGAMALGHVILILLVAASFLMMRSHIDFSSYAWSLMNFYLMFLVSMSIAFLISKVVTSRSMQSAIINSAGLGLSFISGIFVPAQFLDTSIISIAKLFPFYWNVEVNTLIAQKQLSFKSLGLPVAIQLTYCVVCILIALLVSRRKMERSH